MKKASREKMDLAIKSQRVVLPQGITAATILVNKGLIVDIISDGSKTHKKPVIEEDWGDTVIMPALVDTHVHINEPGRTQWEGFSTATQAAAAGGVGTLVDMPLNCSPVTCSVSALDIKLEAVSNQLWVDCGFWGGVTPDSLKDLSALLDAGVLGVKSFMIDSGIDEFPPMQRHQLAQAMEIVAPYQRPYLIHAELSPDTEPQQPVDRSYGSFLQSRPRRWENDAIAQIIELCQQMQGAKCPLHIVHLSSSDALIQIQQAKAAGLPISAETCPHYLCLWSEAIGDGQTLYKCCPPIREQNNRALLWQGLEQGVLDFIASDHSPCTPHLKSLETGSFDQAWGGISSLQFTLPLIWSEVSTRGYSLQQLSHWLCTRPAQMAGLGHFKGKIAVGYQADFVVWNDKIPERIDSEKIKYRHKISPYIGKEVLGKVLATYVRGHLVYRNGQLGKGPIGRPLLANASDFSLY